MDAIGGGNYQSLPIDGNGNQLRDASLRNSVKVRTYGALPKESLDVTLKSGDVYQAVLKGLKELVAQQKSKVLEERVSTKPKGNVKKLIEKVLGFLRSVSKEKSESQYQSLPVYKNQLYTNIPMPPEGMQPISSQSTGDHYQSLPLRPSSPSD